MEALLRVEDLRLVFGGVAACDGVSLEVRAGEILGLIGPNGAGKSSVFNCITLAARPTSGTIRLGDTELFGGWRPRGLRGGRSGTRPHEVVGAGIARTFQKPALFGSMTVLENLLVGQESALRHGVLASVLGLPASRRAEAASRTRASEVLARLDLGPLAGRVAGSLSLVQQKRVELARALVSSPRLLLLDEPAGGLLPGEVEELASLIRRIRDEDGVTVLLIEHHMGLVMSLCDRVVVLNAGRVIAEGTPQHVAAEPAVIEAYLGKEPSAAAAR